MSKYPKVNGALTNYLPAIPDTADGLAPMKKRSFNDAVYAIYRTPAVYAKIRPYLSAVRNKEAVEGSIKFDAARASIEIQEYARQKGVTEVAGATLNRISLALSLGMRWDGIGRHERMMLALEALNAAPPVVDDGGEATATPAE